MFDGDFGNLALSGIQVCKRFFFFSDPNKPGHCGPFPPVKIRQVIEINELFICNRKKHRSFFFLLKSLSIKPFGWIICGSSGNWLAQNKGVSIVFPRRESLISTDSGCSHAP